MKKYRLDLKEILIDKENMSNSLVDNITSVEMVTMDDILPPQVLVEQLKQLFDKLVENFIIKKGEGWVCPKCGAVMSPDQPYCLFCKPVDTRVEVTTTGIMPTINTENKSISKGE